MTIAVDVREFSRDLASYLTGNEPVAVTKHGRRVGVFVPSPGDRAEQIAAYRAASEQLQALIEKHGLDEEEVAAEFDALRKAEHTVVPRRHS